MKRFYNSLEDGIEFYDRYDSYAGRRIADFELIGRCAHIQGEGHEILLYKNIKTGECAIQTTHPCGSELYVFANKDLANEHYRNMLARA